METKDKPFDWSAYNESQTKEKIIFLKLLKDLTQIFDSEGTTTCKGLSNQKTGPMIFCMCMKVFSNISSRRVISDLEICKRMMYIRKVPHFNTLLNYFNAKVLTKNLKYLVRLSALPLAQLESTFAVDGSGVAENKYLPRWSEIRQKHIRHRQYKKIHAIVGVQTNVIASIIISPGNKNDSPYFRQLLDEVAANFEVEEVLADKAYLSRENLQHAGDLSISPFIPFKKNTTSFSRGAPMWNKMYHYFHDNPEEFDKHYFLRNNVETTFSMLKKRFGDFVYSKNEVAQINEILCKAICHNIVVLIQEIFLSKIDIDFDDCARTYSKNVQD